MTREEAPQAVPFHRRFARPALWLALAIVAAALGWLAVSMFRTRPTPAPRSKSVATTPVARPAEVESAPAAASPASVNQVIPDVPRSSRETIRGTIKVSVRMIVDPEGKVLAATVDGAGPSRYFARLALEAAKKWTFAPTDSKDQRIAQVRFDFTRATTTAHVTSMQ